jgi:PAS domain S-box-containing protein
MTKSIKQLSIENTELKSRLNEIEETLASIRNGEMDAIVVSGRKGVQVYSISSAETPYRNFLEEMNEGAVTLSKEGIIVYCNLKFAKLLRQPIESVMGSYLIQFIAADDKSKLARLLSKLTHDINDNLIISLFNTIYLKLSFHVLPSYLEGENIIVIATDISELKNKENELLELYGVLERKLNIIERLRMQLIDKKIDDEVVMNKLKTTNKKLTKEITRHKIVEEELKLKIRKKKVNA